MSDARKYGTTNPVLIEARINHDPYDEFAWVQGWRFAIADYLHFDMDSYVPGFRPGPTPEFTSEFWALRNLAPTINEAAYALEILDRYREWLRIAGRDY